VWTLVYFAGMLFAFVGERIIGAGTARALYRRRRRHHRRGAGGTGGARQEERAQSKRRRAAERMLLALYAAGTFAVALYLAQSDLSVDGAGKPLERDWPKLATTPRRAVAGHLDLLVAAGDHGRVQLPAVTRAPRSKWRASATRCGRAFGLAGALVFCFAITYVATERDKKGDFSYFRVAMPGEATRKIVQNLDQPMQVSIFFPPANEVREKVAD